MLGVVAVLAMLGVLGGPTTILLDVDRGSVEMAGS
jgi:hypothetical protein